MNSHLAVFETTLQKTNELLNMLTDKFGWTDKHWSYSVLRSVLHALRDRLPVENAVALGSQLPLLLRGVYYEGWKPLTTPQKMHKDEFLTKVSAEITQPISQTTEEIVKGSMETLSVFIDPGEAAKIKKVLPGEIAALL